MPRFGVVAEVGEIRIERSVEFEFARADPILEAVELPARFERFELLVGVEDERRPCEPACRAGAIGMQTHDEIAGRCEAIGKIRIFRATRDARIPRVERLIEIVQAAELVPERAFEGSVGIRARFEAREDGDVRRIETLEAAPFVRKRE